ncbi:hypothetical protein UlMin_030105 [Ulmus minor]
MSQEQPRRPQKELIMYEDVFPVQGELAEKPITSVDAAVMQSAETTILGKTKKGGTASTMQVAAAENKRGGVVTHFDVSNIDGEQGISIGETNLPVPLAPPSTFEQGGAGGGITIVEALEATVMTAGQKLVGQSDAAAIQVAEARATGRTDTARGGVAAAVCCQSQCSDNQGPRQNKTSRFGDWFAGCYNKITGDRAATRRDAEGVMDAEMRHDPNLNTHPTGVAAPVAAAARLNQNKDNKKTKIYFML